MNHTVSVQNSEEKNLDSMASMKSPHFMARNTGVGTQDIEEIDGIYVEPGTTESNPADVIGTKQLGDPLSPHEVLSARFSEYSLNHIQMMSPHDKARLYNTQL